jgi:ADP-heptose:LPS heptosyltransferase
MGIAYSSKSIALARFLELCFAACQWLFLLGRRRGGRPSRDFTAVLVEPFQMGDVLSLSVMFDPLLERFPGCRIVIWCHERNRHVFQNDKRVWKIESAKFFWSNRGSKRPSFSDLVSIYRSVGAVRKLRPDIGIDCRGEVRSQALLSLAGCARRIGFRNYFSTNMTIRGLLLNESLGVSPLEHRFLTNLRLLAPLLGDVPELKLPALGQPPVAREAAGLRRVVVHIGAGWAFRQWEPERWVALLDALGEYSDLRLVLIEGPGESEVNTRIVDSVTRPIERVATSYSELLSLLAGASLFIGLDSGPMQAATLLGIPAVVLFGPGDLAVWHPRSAGSVAVHRLEDYPCSPCGQMVCVRASDPCMKRLGAEEVLDAVLGVLYPTRNLVSISPRSEAARPIPLAAKLGN